MAAMYRSTPARYVLTLALGFGLATAAGPAAWATPEQAAAQVERAALSITEGQAFGTVRGEALGAVLEVFVEAAGLSYKAPEELLGHPVSGRFAGEPAAKALERLLRPFDYLAVYRGDGTVERLTVRGLRSGAPASAAVEVGPVTKAAVEGARAPLAEPAVAEDPAEDVEPARQMTEAELIEEAEFSDLEALARDAGVPLEALYEEPAGEGEAPRYNINVLEHLLQRRDAE